MTNVVWLKLTAANGKTICLMFGAGGVVDMEAGGFKENAETALFKSNGHVADVQQSIDEIMTLIGAVRNGVHESDNDRSHGEASARN